MAYAKDAIAPSAISETNDMWSLGIYYGWVLLLFVVNLASWLLNLFALPGNWLIVAASALFAWLVRTGDGEPSVHLLTVAVLVGLAALGEMCEFLAGAAGAAQQGASRRAVVLSVVGAMAGSIIGAVVGVPVPIVGPVIAAVGGGALGAFVGAYVGEHWKGKPHAQRQSVAEGALVGRVLGTVAKFAIGAIMVVAVTFDSVF